MTHAGTLHNPQVGGVWALHQLTSNAWSTNLSNMVRQALDFDNMRGFCLRIPWNYIESNTVQGSYSFSVVQQALNVVNEYPGAQFSIRPISGRYTPTYIYNTLGARNYSTSGGFAPHPCNTNGSPNTIWLNRFFPFMQALIDWAQTKPNVPYIHGTHFSDQYSEFYHGPPVRSPNAGYDTGNANFNTAHEALWDGVWDIVDGTGICTEFGMSGTHVEDIQINAVEHLHSLAGDWSPYLIINANGCAGSITGGTDWGSPPPGGSEYQQDANCGFYNTVTGVFNPPANRRVSRMLQMIQPGNYSNTYWHNVFITVRNNRSEGVELYLADGTAVGAPGTTFGGAGAAALQDEITAWMEEVTGVGPTTPEGPIVVTLPKFTQAMVATRDIPVGATEGIIDSEMPKFTQAMEAEYVPPVGEGIIASVLPKFRQEASGRSGVKRYLYPQGGVTLIDGTGLLLPDAPLRRPDVIPIGLFDRSAIPNIVGSGSAWTGVNPRTKMAGFVQDVYWSQLQPTSAGQTFPSNPIDTAIETASLNDMQLKVRVHFGVQSPNWAKSEGAGPLTLFEPQSGNTFTCPAWWEDALVNARSLMWQQFAERYNAFTAPDGPIFAVTMGGAMTRYAEPHIRQNSAVENRNVYTLAGYTIEADLNAQAVDIDDHFEILCCSSLASNPYQIGDTVHINVSHTINLMNYARQELGLYAVLGNNSDRIEDSFPSAKLQTIYDRIEAEGAPSYIQTAAPSRVGNLYDTCLHAVDMGVTYIELPGTTAQYTGDGVLGMTPTQFDTINAGLLANAAAIGYTP